jgi:hypothetical protein
MVVCVRGESANEVRLRSPGVLNANNRGEKMADLMTKNSHRMRMLCDAHSDHEIVVR